MFDCDCCGCCCKSLNKSELYEDLNRGDGICKYLIENLCSVYDERPLFCRIDECYELFFKDSLSLEDYYKLNHYECDKLKNMED